MCSDKFEEVNDSHLNTETQAGYTSEPFPIIEIGGDPLFVEIIDLDFDVQLYPGTGIGGRRGSVDEYTNDFARSAFGGSDYDDNLDMDQQSQEYWNRIRK